MTSSIVKFLNEHYTDSVFYSHVSLIPRTGKYQFNRDSIEEFWRIYCTTVLENDDTENPQLFGIAEKPEHYLPVLVDFDIKILNNSDIEIGEHLYTDDQLKQIVQIFQSVLRNIVEGCNEDNLLCIVLEKPIYYVNSNNVSYIKNGFHLSFSNIFLSKSDQEVHLFPRVKEILKTDNVFESLGFESSEHLLDASSTKVPWLMYGSRKNEKQDAYKVTRVINSEGDEVDLEEALKYYQLFDSREELINIKGQVKYYLPRILSTRLSGRSISELKHGLVSPLKVNTVKKQKEKNSNVKISVTEALKESEKLITMLGDFRVSDRNAWMEIGWILYNIGEGCDEALEQWLEFSARDEDKYDECICIAEWEKMTKKDYTLGTLKYYAKLDSPELYEEYKQEQGQKHVQNALNGNHYDIAKLMYEEHGTDFVCSSITNKTWFYFSGNRWEEIEEGVFLRDKISTDIVEKFALKGGEFFSQAASTDKANEKKIYENIKNTQNLISKLKNSSYKNGVMRECCDIFYDRNFKHKLDQNPYLIGFKNGVYDLKLNIFRNGKPEDYMTKCMNIEYTNFDPVDNRVLSVYDFLEKVFPDTSIRQYFMDQASDVFVGGNHQKVVLFWTGDGDNGKSVTQNIFEKMLGEYAIKFSTTLLTGKKVANGAANPELARAGGGVRWAVLEEPDGDEEINIGYLKTLSGDDSYFTRDLFEKGKQTREIKPQFKLVFICLAGETKVSLSSGCSISLEKMIKNKQKLLSWDSENDGLININQNAFIDKGIQDCITLTLLDGRKITCTPNHRFLTNENKWIEAKDIKINNTKLKMGVNFPSCDDIFDDYDYILDAGEFVFDMKNLDDRVKVCAFSRLLGYTLSGQSDSENISNDIFLLTGEKNNYVFHNDSKLPNFLFDKNCPDFVIREYIAGLFGRDGILPSLINIHLVHNLPSLLNIHLVCNSVENYRKISSILKERFNINSVIEVKKDFLRIIDILEFCEKIGFRYCYHKSYKSTTFKSYLKYQKITQQNIMTFDEFLKHNKMQNSFYEMEVIHSQNVGEKQVYDLNVDEPYSNFIAEGIVTHNCNKLPNLKHADKATWNRVRVIPFESTFVRPGDECPETYEEQLLQKRFPMDREFSKKIPDLLQAFAWVLLQHRQNIKVRIEPEKVRMATAMYQKQNDSYRQYIEECIKSDSDKYITLIELYSSFKDWYKEGFPGRQIPNKNEISEYFTKIWGEPMTGMKWKGYRLKTLQDDIDNGDAVLLEDDDLVDYDRPDSLI